MSSRLEDLRDLAQMLDEGKISQREFEMVKTEILEAPPEEWAATAAPSTEAASNGAGAPADGSEVEKPDDGTTSSLAGWIAVAKQVPRVYWYALGGMVVTILLANVLFSGGQTVVNAAPLPPSSDAEPIAPVGSLGLRLEDVAEGWNALDRPPYIVKGISITPEPGALDSFIYRFDGGALLAGAYNPSDEFVYALMIRAGLRDETVSNMYVHVCYLLHPGSQGCLDTYFDEAGLFGKSLDEFTDVDHQASWEFEGNEWRLAIEDNIQTIRVLGPQEAD